MAKVGIVTDTTNVLPPELIKEYDIRIVPMTFTMEDKTYRDMVDITTSEFYRIYRKLTKPPTTSGAMTADFLDAFRKLGKTTNSIACIIISADLSATYKAAHAAKDIMKDEAPGVNIEIIDSRTVIGALGFIVLEAARAAKDGKDLNQVVEVAKSMIPRVHLLLMVETLKYLIRGGRAPKVGGWVGEMLRVKPIMGISDAGGVLQPMGRVRTKNKAMAHLVEMGKEKLGGKKPAHVIIHFADLREDGERLKEMVSSQLDCSELYISELTPVMLIHTGPLLGLSFYA